MRLRTSLRLPPRSLAFEFGLAVLSGLAVSAVSWSPERAVLSAPLVVSTSIVVSVLLLLFRRTAPLIPFLWAAGLAVISPAVGGALPLAAYAVGRYSARWPVRVVAGVVGAVAVTRLWTLPELDDALSSLASLAVAVLLPGAVGAYVRTRADLMNALRERAERAEAEQELLARDAVLTERTRIAREMHDAVGHRVSLMVLQAGAIEMAAKDPERVEQLAGQVQTAGRQALDELRQMVGVLRAGETDDAPLVPQPGIDALPRLVDESRQAGMAVQLTSPSDGAHLDPAVSRAAYRIVQEALTNAGKHAPGAAVGVAVERPAGQLVVRVISGPGHAPGPTPGGGYGLVGLAERVRTLGGRLTAESRLDGGFLVEAVLPA
jgi:signal transduction histidine kinase